MSSPARSAVIRAPQVGLSQPVSLTLVRDGAATGEDGDPSGVAETPRTSTEVLAEAQALRDEARQMGYEEGRQQGYADGRAAAEAEMSGLVGRLASLAAGVVQEHAAFYRDAERQVIELAITLASRVVEREVENVPDLALGVLRAALEDLDAQTLVRVRVSPEDEEIIQRRWSTIHPSTGRIERVEVVGDPRVQSGGAVLETAGGRIDAQPTTKLEMLADALRNFVDEREDGSQGTD